MCCPTPVDGIRAQDRPFSCSSGSAYATRVAFQVRLKQSDSGRKRVFITSVNMLFNFVDFTVGFATPILGHLPSNMLINGDLAAIAAHGDPKPRDQRAPLRSSCHRATSPHMATNIHAHNEHPCAHIQANMPRRERFLTTGHKPRQRRTPPRSGAPRARRAAAGPPLAPFPTRPSPASAKATHDSVPPQAWQRAGGWTAAIREQCAAHIVRFAACRSWSA